VRGGGALPRSGNDDSVNRDCCSSASLKRLVARVAVICVLLTPFAITGCGAAGHYAGNVLAHKIANHFAKTPAAKRRVNQAFCAYSVYRALHDLTQHHLVFGALNAHQALKNCEAGFLKTKR
jgi:hypothetical protein